MRPIVGVHPFLQTYGALHFGIKFLSRDARGVKLEVFGRVLSVEILACVEFTSLRKRSSVLCHFPKSNGTFGNDAIDRVLSSERYVLYCKVTAEEIRCPNLFLFCPNQGADTVILERLKSVRPDDSKSISLMEEYAKDGLRTLCIAKKELEEGVVLEWYKTYEAACLSLKDRQKKIDS